ncbi:ketoacyl-ACP synthase III [Viridibacillus arvi]|uniref:ketoacyl-ACP synthase III n=1 Tax=Viridibacillus arvi TaxID=263475 RepID=UPI003D07EE35
MTNIKIKEIAIYHPENSVENDYYIEHFKKIHGEDYSHFFCDILGRKSRYIIDNDEENSLSVAVEASKRVLKTAKMNAQDLDMIIFASQVPEFVFPTNSVLVHRAIQAGTNTGIMDMNTNCSGMTTALDQASRYLLGNPHMNRILLVGSDYLSLVPNPEDSITYPNFGDAACALILEKTDEDTGFIDSIYFTDSSNFNRVTFPRSGLSKKLKGLDSTNYLQWLPFDGDVSLPNAYKIIDTLLERNNLKPEDVDSYCLSQFSITNINKMQKHLNLKNEQMIYVGDKFGYTGTTSPLLALHEGIQDGRIKRGDTVLFWTVGVGYQLIAVLFKY